MCQVDLAQLRKNAVCSESRAPSAPAQGQPNEPQFGAKVMFNVNLDKNGPPAASGPRQVVAIRYAALSLLSFAAWSCLCPWPLILGQGWDRTGR